MSNTTTKQQQEIFKVVQTDPLRVECIGVQSLTMYRETYAKYNKDKDPENLPLKTRLCLKNPTALFNILHEHIPDYNLRHDKRVSTQRIGDECYVMYSVKVPKGEISATLSLFGSIKPNMKVTVEFVPKRYWEGSKYPKRAVTSTIVDIECSVAEQVDESRKKYNVGELVDAFKAVCRCGFTTCTSGTGWFPATIKKVRAYPKGKYAYDVSSHNHFCHSIQEEFIAPFRTYTKALNTHKVYLNELMKHPRLSDEHRLEILPYLDTTYKVGDNVWMRPSEPEAWQPGTVEDIKWSREDDDYVYLVRGKWFPKENLQTYEMSKAKSDVENTTKGKVDTTEGEKKSTQENKYNVSELVDFYYKGGWYPGTITRVRTYPSKLYLYDVKDVSLGFIIKELKENFISPFRTRTKVYTSISTMNENLMKHPCLSDEHRHQILPYLNTTYKVGDDVLMKRVTGWQPGIVEDIKWSREYNDYVYLVSRKWLPPQNVRPIPRVEAETESTESSYSCYSSCDDAYYSEDTCKEVQLTEKEQERLKTLTARRCNPTRAARFTKIYVE